MKLIGNKDRRVAYNRWINMKQRCRNKNNPDYIHYGGRGIEVCDEFFNSYLKYSNYISSLPNANIAGYTIDRIDNNKGYEVGNLRWADYSTQRSNTRIRKDNTSGYKGVCLNQGKWKARKSVNGKRINIGTFNTKEEAIKAHIEFCSEC